MEIIIIKILFFILTSFLSADYYIAMTNTVKKTRNYLFLAILFSYFVLLLPTNGVSEVLYDIIQIVVELVFIFVLTADKIIKKIVVYIWFNVFEIIGIIVGYIFYRMWGNAFRTDDIGKKLIYVLVYLLVTEVLCIIMIQINRKRGTDIYNPRGIELTVTMGLAVLFILYAVGASAFDNDKNMQKEIIYTLFSFVVLAIIFIWNFNKRIMEKENKEIRKFVLDNYCKSVDILENEYRVKEEEYATKIDSLKKELNEIYVYLGKEKEMLEKLVDNKVNKAREMGINISVDKDISERNNMLIEDQICIVANLLDNAIRATGECEKSRIYSVYENDIIMCLKVSKEEFKLYIENTYDGRLNIKAGRLYSTKENKQGHGLGIENVKKTLDKYGKYINISTKGERFIVLVDSYERGEKERYKS